MAFLKIIDIMKPISGIQNTLETKTHPKVYTLTLEVVKFLKKQS